MGLWQPCCCCLGHLWIITWEPLTQCVHRWWWLCPNETLFARQTTDGIWPIAMFYGPQLLQNWERKRTPTSASLLSTGVFYAVLLTAEHSDALTVLVNRSTSSPRDIIFSEILPFYPFLKHLLSTLFWGMWFIILKLKAWFFNFANWSLGVLPVLGVWGLWHWAQMHLPIASILGGFSHSVHF